MFRTLCADLRTLLKADSLSFRRRVRFAIYSLRLRVDNTSNIRDNYTLFESLDLFNSNIIFIVFISLTFLLRYLYERVSYILLRIITLKKD